MPDAGGGRLEEARIRPARLAEGATLEWIPVGAAEPWPGTLAFLDGVQRLELVGYHHSSMVLLAEIAAAVRERRDRRFMTVLAERQALLIGRPAALAAMGDLEGMATIALPADEAPHPSRDLANAARVLDAARGALELRLGHRYRATSDGWLLVDGPLSESPAWAADPRLVGIWKSHATLPFEGDDLDRYLRLPAGCRSSIYRPDTRSLAPVNAWGLRLWPWEGKDLFHGLVRVEVAPTNGTPEVASRLSRWLLAERAPISTPDARWDRLLYGIHAVGDFLRAGSGGRR